MNAADDTARKAPTRDRTLLQIFFWPLLIGGASALGLIGALLEDGLWDALFCALLAIPAAVGALFALRRA